MGGSEPRFPKEVPEGSHRQIEGAKGVLGSPDRLKKKSRSEISKNEKISLDIFEYVVHTLSLDTLGTRGRL